MVRPRWPTAVSVLGKCFWQNEPCVLQTHLRSDQREPEDLQEINRALVNTLIVLHYELPLVFWRYFNKGANYAQCAKKRGEFYSSDVLYFAAHLSIKNQVSDVLLKYLSKSNEEYGAVKLKQLVGLGKFEDHNNIDFQGDSTNLSSVCDIKEISSKI